ncbi:cytidine deaminase [Staphylococcus pseudintermedius]|uniref:cytidine deaminase n=1 Tax=Staphylococcus pseudintermedius TaxID=283734 RepID=UPI00286DEF61|nr:cytidine deaminase [Staphylococcus pseudintermedius]WMZ91513.1 cytidine deaminase [Staphylococcus pseudintermedius]
MGYTDKHYTEVRKAQQKAYAPYSQFKVGAYLVTKDGQTFHGANVENAAYPSCICAERSALVAAISQGYKPGDFESITITVDSPELASPCGPCLQVIHELCDDDMPVYMTNQTGEMREATVAELLPYGFSGKDLNL